MYRLKKINLGSVAVYSFVLIFILGVIIMLPFGAINMFLSGLMPSRLGPPHTVFPFSAVFYFFFPIMYAVMGTIVNVILAFIYNMVSKPLGGLRFDLEKIAEFEETE